MFLCLDVGNTNLCGGAFENDNLLIQFRYDTTKIGTSDELGIFIRNVLRENQIEYSKITRIGIASVVPSIDYTIRAACIKYLKQEPLFLKPGVKTGLKIKTINPNSSGADLIAGSIAAKNIEPNKDLLIFDFGTATTCSYVSAQNEFLGVSIAPGFRIMAEALQSKAAQLFCVDIVKPEVSIAKSTRAAMQSGIFYSQLGFIECLIANTITENNLSKRPTIFATGGFSHLFASYKIFDYIIPELALLGIKAMLNYN